MARYQVLTSRNGTRQAETLGTSSSGDLCIEVDLAKFTYFNDLKNAVLKALQELRGQLKE